MTTTLRVNLTLDRIRDIPVPEGKKQTFVWDSSAPGLAVRATAGGKAYIFQSRLQSRSIRITIGSVKVWDLDGARIEARRLQSLVDQYIDPRAEKAKRLATAETAEQERALSRMTAQEAWDEYIRTCAPSWGERHLKDHLSLSHPGGAQKRSNGARPGDKTKAGPLASLMLVPLGGLNKQVIESWARKETAQRPARTRLAYSLLRAFLAWCIEHERFGQVVTANPCTTQLAKRVLAKSGTRDDCLEKEQLSAWFDAVRNIANPVISAYLQILLLTGARREELLKLRWEDVDFRWKRQQIRDKVEGKRIVPLTPYVTTLIQALPRRNEWVFSSETSASGRLREPTLAHRSAVAISQIPHLTLQGLRRSFSTLSEWVECPRGVVAQIMGHKPSAIAEKHYIRRPIDLIRQWHTQIEEWILKAAERRSDVTTTQDAYKTAPASNHASHETVLD